MEDNTLDFKRKLERLALEPIKSDDYVSPLNDALMQVKGKVPVNDTTKTVIKGVTDKINTKEVQKLISGSGFQDKIKSILESRAASKLAKNSLKSIPFLGTAMGIGSALMSRDASAAIPVLNEAEAVGPTEGSLEAKLENGTITPDEMQQLMARSNGR